MADKQRNNSYPPIFIPFYDSISEAPLVKLLLEHDIDFFLVTHASNSEGADSARRMAGNDAVYLLDKPDASYSDLLNEIRSNLAPENGWFWILHPQVSGFLSAVFGDSKVKANQGARNPVFSTMDCKAALSYRFPILKSQKASDKKFTLVELSLHHVQTHVKVAESVFLEPPFAICINNFALSSSIHFRGCLNEIRDFRLQLFSKKLKVSTPNTITAEVSLQKGDDLSYNRMKSYNLDPSKINFENSTLQHRWGHKICPLKTQLNLQTWVSKSHTNLNEPIIIPEIQWDFCKTHDFHEPANSHEVDFEQNVREYIYSQSKSKKQKMNRSPNIESKPSELVGEENSNLIQSEEEFLHNEEQDAESGSMRKEHLHHAIDDCIFPGTQSNHQRKTPSQAMHVENETYSNERFSQTSDPIDDIDDDMPLSNIPIEQVAPLCAAMSETATLSLSETQSVRKTSIAHIIDDLREALKFDSELIDDLFVGIIFDKDSLSFEISWKALSCTSSTENSEDLATLIQLLSDADVTKICWRSYDLYTEILTRNSRMGFRPQSVYDISIANFYIGQHRDPKEDIAQEVNRLKSETRDVSPIDGMVSLCKRYLLQFKNKMDGFRIANEASFVMAVMECTGVCLDPKAMKTTRQRIQSLVDTSILPENLDIALRTELLNSLPWSQSSQIDALAEQNEMGKIHFGFRHSYHTGRILIAYNVADVFCPNQPSQVEINSDRADSPLKLEIPHLGKAIVAPKGMFILSIEFPALELQLLAYLANDPYLISLNEKGIDIYAFVKHAQMSNHRNFNNAIESFEDCFVSEEERINFQQLAKGCICDSPLNFLSSRTQTDYNDVQAFVETFYHLFPSVEEYRQRIFQDCTLNSEVRTIGEARKLFPPSKDLYARESAENILPSAVDFIIQGSIGDFMNSRLVTIENLRTSYRRSPFLLIMQAKETIFFYIDERFFSKIVPTIKEALMLWNTRKFHSILKGGYSVSNMQKISMES